MNLTFKGTLLLLFLVLSILGSSVSAFAQQECERLPDATIANPKNNFTFCSFNTSTASANLAIENRSSTKASNATYHIAWGDGNSSTFGKDFETTSYIYRSTGLFNLVLTVTGEDGCITRKTYEVFVGSNPGIGISREGNSSDCAPVSYIFKFNSFEGNSPYTTYRIKVDDGSPIITRTHQQMLANPYFEHTFTESSKDLPEGFTLEVLASNPCFTTRNAWTGIRISKGPVAKIGSGLDFGCLNQPIKLKDASTSGYDASSKVEEHNTLWEITPATGWKFTTGTVTDKDPVIVFTEPGTYKLKLTVTPADEYSNCEGSFIEQDIVILPPPTAKFSLTQSPENGCGPNTVAVTNASEGENIIYNWVVTKADGTAATGWSFMNGTSSSSKTPQFNFTTPGNYNIALTASNGCSPNSTVSEQITIKGRPLVTLPAAPAPYCGPTTIAYTEANNAHKPVYDANFGTITGYTWSVTRISGQGEYSFANGTTSATRYPAISFGTSANAETVYEVAVTAVNECGDASPVATQRINILPVPVVTVTAPKPAICIGESITLTATGAAAFTWQAAEGLVATTGNKITVKPTKTTTYTVTGKNNETGCSTTAQYTVVVNPLPTVAVTTSAPEICVGQSSATLTATGATTYTWAPATGLSATSGASVTASPAATTTYTVTGFDAATGCSSTAKVTVKVNALPQVNAGEDMLVCDNPAPIKLTGSPAGGTWSGAHVSADGFFTPAGMGSFVVRYTYTNAAGCSNTDELTVRVAEALVANAGNDREVCLNSGSFALAGAPAGGTWSGSQYVTKDGTFTPSAAGTYTLTYTYFTGTCSTTDQVQVTVKPLPATPTVRATTICYDATATLAAENAEGTVVWFDAKGEELHRGTTYTTRKLTATTKFFAETLGDNGCTSPRTEVQVVVRPQTPAPIVEAVTLCGPGVAALVAQGTAENYNWYDADGTFTFTGKTFNPQVNATTTYYAEGIIAGCTGPRTAVQVTVLPVLKNNSISTAQTICFGQTPKPLSGTQPEGGTGAFTYRWESSLSAGTGFTAIAGATGATYVPKALEHPTWFRRVVISGVCTNVSEAVMITVTPLITKNTIGSNRTICENSPAGELTGSKPEGGTDVYEYLWESSTKGTVDGFGPAAGINTTQSYDPGSLKETTWFRRVVKSGTCNVSISDLVKVTVVTPVASNTLTGNPVVCGGNMPVTLSGTQPTGGDGDYKFKWEVSTDGVAFATAPGVNNTPAYTPSTYNQPLWYRRVVTAGPCAPSVSNAVQVLPDVSNNIISKEKTICFGDAFETLTGTAPQGGDGDYTYIWMSSSTGAEGSFTPAAGKNTEASYTAPAPLAETTWYRRVVKSGPCSVSNSNSIRITVQPAIAGNTIAAEELTVCAGSAPAGIKGSLPTGGNNTYTYLWESSTDGVTYVQAEGAAAGINYQPARLVKSTWFRRSVYSGQCVSVSEAVKVTVNEIITQNQISQDQAICTGSAPVKLTGSQPAGSVGNFSYQWQFSANGKNGPFTNVENGTQSDFAPGVLTTTTWFRRVVNSGACADVSNVVEITVSPLIARNTVALAQEIYKGQTPSPLTGSSPTGGNNAYTYLWESSTEGADKGFQPATGVNNKQHYEPGPLTKNTWYRRTVYSGGCENTSVAIAITVIPDIINNTIQAGQSICYGNKPAQLTGTVPAGGEGHYAYLWQASTQGPAEGFITAAGQNNQQHYSPAALTQDTWFRRVVVSGPFTNTSAVVLIKVNPAMTNNTISTSHTICYGTAASPLNGSRPTGGSGAYTYLWESSTSGPDKGFKAAAGVSTDMHYTPGTLTQTTWYRRTVSSESCDKLVSNVIAVTVNPLPAVPVTADVTICYGTSTVLKATGTGGRLQWYTGSEGAPIIGSEFKTPVLTKTTTFYVEEVAASCPGARKAVTVTVTPPSAYAGEDVTILTGRSVMLGASGGVSYSWSPAAGLSNTNTDKPMARPEVTTTYTVTVTTAAGCVSTDQVTVTVLPLVDVPNTFTPNRDGINDTWEIKNLNLYPQCKVQVFNQWGTQVFNSNGYLAPWDGRHNGQELPIATYYYIIQLGTNEKPLSGSVTIVK